MDTWVIYFPIFPSICPIYFPIYPYIGTHIQQKTIYPNIFHIYPNIKNTSPTVDDSRLTQEAAFLEVSQGVHPEVIEVGIPRDGARLAGGAGGQPPPMG